MERWKDGEMERWEVGKVRVHDTDMNEDEGRDCVGSSLMAKYLTSHEAEERIRLRQQKIR